LNAPSNVLSPAQAAACLEFARFGLRNALGAPAQVLFKGAPELSFEKVNLTIRTYGKVRASVSGYGTRLDQAIDDACKRAVLDNRFGNRLTLEELRDSNLELWIQHDSVIISSPAEIRIGLDGVELRVGSRWAYYKPSVALTSAIVTQHKLLTRLAKKARLDTREWKSPQAKILRTTWNHYAEVPKPKPRSIHLRRLRPVTSRPLCDVEVRRAALLAADRLVAVQSSEGFYRFTNHPFKRIMITSPVNYVRQAGCAFAISRIAETFSDTDPERRLFKSATRAAEFLLGSFIELDGGGMFLVEPKTQRGWLGTSALTLAALQRGQLASRFQDERCKLITGILSLQRGDGSFYCSNEVTSARDDGSKQNYYPGEALMALCQEICSGSRAAIEPTKKAFGWYRDYFRRNPTTAFILWQADAWRLLSEWCRGNDQGSDQESSEYAAFVFEIVDWLLQFQLTDPSMCAEDFLGGFARFGAEPGYSTATYTEAIIRAYGLACRVGSQGRQALYYRAARLGLGFILRLQIVPETAFLFDDPSVVVGGVTKSLSDFTLRCDFDQHAITACLAALETPGLL
jgi:AMMECR1